MQIQWILTHISSDSIIDYSILACAASVFSPFWVLCLTIGPLLNHWSDTLKRSTLSLSVFVSGIKLKWKGAQCDVTVLHDLGFETAIESSCGALKIQFTTRTPPVCGDPPSKSSQMCQYVLPADTELMKYNLKESTLGYLRGSAYRHIYLYI